MVKEFVPNTILTAQDLNDAFDEVYEALDDKADAQAVSEALGNKADAQAVSEALDDKVEKVQGKGLSSQDYTLTEKNKLNEIQAQATKNLSDADLLDRENHTGVQAMDTIDGLEQALSQKVDMQNGKGLSQENFTTSLKNKLSGIASGATSTAAPVNADWNANIGLAQILNKPAIPSIPSKITVNEAKTGTATAQRTIDARTLKTAIEYHGPSVPGPASAAQMLVAVDGDKFFSPDTYKNTIDWKDLGTVGVGTTTLDLNEALNFYLTVNGNATMGAPTNAMPGKSGAIRIMLSGSRTVSWHSNWKFAGGTPSIGSYNSVWYVTYRVFSATEILASAGEIS